MPMIGRSQPPEYCSSNQDQAAWWSVGGNGSTLSGKGGCRDAWPGAAASGDGLTSLADPEIIGTSTRRQQNDRNIHCSWLWHAQVLFPAGNAENCTICFAEFSGIDQVFYFYNCN